MQTWLAVVSSALSLLALGIAFWTLRDQQEINRSQLKINQAQLGLAKIENERYEQRYAARVSFWYADRAPDEVNTYPTFVIYNRSPVPIMRIHFEMAQVSVKPTPHVLYGGNLNAPPCSILTVRVLYDDYTSQPKAPAHDRPMSMRFLDTVGWWRITTVDSIQFGAVRAPVPLDEGDRPPIQIDPAFALREIPGTRQEAPDCGEGGYRG
ncbi:hypothetical protein [Micromonospora sp. DH14]|uniref:hypothetical protein n=1 Tax=Micromonospora sp. DH14 TaxID=3040120 RepID=UPI0024416A9A|nr:hypothetical protein [Micromonospora sp. DH14]MDG9678995.1 hypothetical protein [Micromonospora sp. DH14]